MTTGGPEETYREGGIHGNINGILRPIHRGIFQFVGFDVLAPQVVYGPVRMTDEQRKNALAAYAIKLRGIFIESAMHVGDY